MLHSVYYHIFLWSARPNCLSVYYSAIMANIVPFFFFNLPILPETFLKTTFLSSSSMHFRAESDDVLTYFFNSLIFHYKSKRMIPPNTAWYYWGILFLIKEYPSKNFMVSIFASEFFLFFPCNNINLLNRFYECQFIS